MNDYTDEKRDQMLAKVRKLIERANHPNTPEAEADSSRAMAEALMLKYRITEAAGVMAGDTTVTPVWKEVDLVVSGSEFATFYHRLAGAVQRHIGAQGVTSWRQDEHTGQHVTMLRWVGYSSDLAYGEMLLTAGMVEFSKRLEPNVDRELSDRENIYNLRHAGMERKRIAKLIYGDWSTENEMKAKNRRVTAEFKKACEERGEDWSVLLGRGNSVKSYREDYAEGFVETFNLRLMRMRNAAGEKGSGLVLADRSQRVKEAFWTRYPQYRPDDKPAEPWKDPSEDCPKCKRAKSGYCRDHGYLRPSKAQYRGRYVNQTARRRGREAASLVDLGPNATGRGRVGNTSRGELG